MTLADCILELASSVTSSIRGVQVGIGSVTGPHHAANGAAMILVMPHADVAAAAAAAAAGEMPHIVRSISDHGASCVRKCIDLLAFVFIYIDVCRLYVNVSRFLFKVLQFIQNDLDSQWLSIVIG